MSSNLIASATKKGINLYLVVWTDYGVLYSCYVRDENLENEYCLAPHADKIRKLNIFQRDLFGEKYLVFRFQ